ncbi:unnamed protein product [Cuscuta epithymum]|uniref:Uncharacterized protein n=1 Tax=Cuscuta epithymum TaxID=186058 RepID=A0AAV0FTR9_9ASTE|nr:unnamed protein product [Cuscuta epithymum]CAH9139009.1 unnamed protein product [Cuscuta epithymum]
MYRLCPGHLRFLDPSLHPMVT